MKSKIFGYIFGTARPAAGGRRVPRLRRLALGMGLADRARGAGGGGGARRALPARAQSGTWQIAIGISYYALSLVGETSTKGLIG